MMGKRIAILALVLLLAGLNALAGSDAAEDSVYARYSGNWYFEDCLLELKYEEGTMTGNMLYFEKSGDIINWDFTSCIYVPEDDILWCNGCTHYRTHIDPQTHERTEEDWWMSDLSDIYFAFGDDEDTLIGYDIEDLGEPVVLRRSYLEALFDS